ncbi:MAG: hypothetical protein ACTTIC_04330 [Helicobacteraceae bacterium]
MDNIADLLKIPVKEIPSKEGFEREFDRVADVLLNKVVLHAGADTFLIKEIEFYLYADNHKDVYCHQHDRQKMFLSCYFHRFKDPLKYKNLKCKGFDITLGDDDFHCGVLIRAIKNEQTNKLVEGPAKVTEAIMSSLEKVGASIEELYKQEKLYEQDKLILNEKTALIHLGSSTKTPCDPKKTPRKNLKYKEEYDDCEFLCTKYNYSCRS